MADYFSDRENGPRARTEHVISPTVWAGLVATVQALVNSGAFGLQFPERCQDGQAICGCDSDALAASVMAEMPGLNWPLVVCFANDETIRFPRGRQKWSLSAPRWFHYFASTTLETTRLEEDGYCALALQLLCTYRLAPNAFRPREKPRERLLDENPLNGHYGTALVTVLGAGAHVWKSPRDPARWQVKAFNRLSFPSKFLFSATLRNPLKTTLPHDRLCPSIRPDFMG